MIAFLCHIRTIKMAAQDIDLIALVMSGYLVGFAYRINCINVCAIKDSIFKSKQISRHYQSNQINVQSSHVYCSDVTKVIRLIQ